ncbi:MAG: hypothetical protein Q8P67_16390 [archaeon]|nr:hypothetical protein [archaeon]
MEAGVPNQLWRRGRPLRISYPPGFSRNKLSCIERGDCKQKIRKRDWKCWKRVHQNIMAAAVGSHEGNILTPIEDDFEIGAELGRYVNLFFGPKQITLSQSFKLILSFSFFLFLGSFFLFLSFSFFFSFWCCFLYF